MTLRKIAILLTAGFVFAAGSYVGVQATINPNSCTSGIVVFDRCLGSGYFTNGGAVNDTSVILKTNGRCSGRNGRCAIHDDVNSLDTFISYLQSKNGDGNSVQSKVGSAFIVYTMLGINGTDLGSRGPDPNNGNIIPPVSQSDWDDLRARLNNFPGSIDWGYQNYNLNTGTAINAYYMGHENNVANGDDSFHLKDDNAPSIVFRGTDGTVMFVIDRNCANMMANNSIRPLPGYSYTLTPTVTLSSSVVQSNTEFTVKPLVQNTGTTASKNNTIWQLTRTILDSGQTIPHTDPGSSTLAPCAYLGSSDCQMITNGANATFGANTTVNVGNVTGNSSTYTVGKKICYILSVQPHSSSSDQSEWGYSGTRCVTVGKTPKVQIWGGDLITGRSFNGSFNPLAIVDTSLSSLPGSSVTSGRVDVAALWETGVDNNHIKLPQNVDDPHWTLERIYNPVNGVNPCQTGIFPRPATTIKDTSNGAGHNNTWKRVVDNARWIGQNYTGENDSHDGCPDPTRSHQDINIANVYVFKLTNNFNIDSDVDLNSVQVLLRGAVDNTIMFVVNGVSLGGYKNPGFGDRNNSVTVTSDSSATAFRNSGNTLEVYVQSTYSMTGILIDQLKVTGTRTTIVPSKSFGSWVEYGLFAGGNITNMASGSGINGGVAGDYCNWSNLSFALPINKTSCSNGTVIGNYTNSRSSIPDVAASFPGTGTPFTGTVLNEQPKNSADSITDIYNAVDVHLSTNELPKNRSIIIKASGTVYIDGNLTYNNGPYADVLNLPQLVIIANKIVISSAATRVDAWLIAKGADGTIQTCEVPGNSSGVCSAKLTVNGPVMAQHLYLYRTDGAGPGLASGDPAEVFNLRPDAYLWAYARSISSGHVQTVKTTELPPRF